MHPGSNIEDVECYIDNSDIFSFSLAPLESQDSKFIFSRKISKSFQRNFFRYCIPELTFSYPFAVLTAAICLFFSPRSEKAFGTYSKKSPKSKNP
jgi:hypothetical protein